MSCPKCGYFFDTSHVCAPGLIGYGYPVAPQHACADCDVLRKEVTRLRGIEDAAKAWANDKTDREFPSHLKLLHEVLAGRCPTS